MLSERGEGFRRILVPTDLTNRAVKALRLASRLAEPGRSRITLLHVIETVRGVDFGELKSFYRQLEAKARAEMAAIQRRALRSGVKATVDVVYGRRAEGIVEFARRSGVDLIVLPSHRVNPTMVGRDWGTISYKVGILAACPVLLVK